MTRVGIIGVVVIAGWLGAIPAAGHDCGHHHYACDGCRDCGNHGCAGGPSARASALSGQAAKLLTVEGKVAEVDYLPGATADSGIVEIRVQTAGQAKLVRLAPAGFLRLSGLQLHEGDTVVVKGYPVTGMEGDLIVATDVRKGDATLSLRDGQGRPVW